MAQDCVAERKQLTERIKELKSNLSNSIESLKNGFKSEAEKIKYDDLYFKSQLKYVKLCDPIADDIRADSPPNPFANKLSMFDVHCYAQDTELDFFRGLERFRRPAFMQDPLPPGAASAAVPNSGLRRALFDKAELPSLARALAPPREPLFLASDEEPEKSVEKTYPPLPRGLSPLPALDARAGAEGGSEQMTMELTVDARPLNMSIDGKSMVVKQVLAGAAQRAGVRTGDLVMMVNYKAASMDELANAELPVKLTVMRGMRP